jgi:hypothetical protein
MIRFLGDRAAWAESARLRSFLPPLRPDRPTPGHDSAWCATSGDMSVPPRFLFSGGFQRSILSLQR